jgi:hypothetical protein
MADLREVMLVDELRDLHLRGWSGIVAVGRGEVRKALYLRRGRFVFAASVVEEDRLGEYLVRTGRLRRAQLDQALVETEEAGRRLGQTLVDMGAVLDSQIESLVAEQVRDIALSLFRWTEGDVFYQEMAEPLPHDLAMPLSMERLLLEGARVYPDVQRMEAALGDPRRRVRRSSRPAVDIATLPGVAAESQVLERATLGPRIRDLLPTGAQRPALVRAVYGLLASGLLVEQEESAAPFLDLTPPRGVIIPEIPKDSDLGFTPPVAPSTGAPTAVAPGVVEREARDLLDKGLHDRAIALLRETVARDPRAVSCRRLLALTLSHSSGFSAELEKHFQVALQADPRDQELRYRLACWYKKNGFGSRAISQLRTIVNADPSHVAAWRDLAELEAKEGGPGRGRR